MFRLGLSAEMAFLCCFPFVYGRFIRRLDGIILLQMQLCGFIFVWIVACNGIYVIV